MRQGVHVELVPFRNQWAGSETKLDLKAWYRRSSTHGGFSLVGPFPLRRHLDFARKGFEYVTLATVQDLRLVATSLQADGLDIEQLRKAYDRQGNFDTAAYLKDAKATDEAYLAELQAKVDKFGADVVTEMMRVTDPDFVMPEGIAVAVKSAKKAVVN